MDATSPLVFSAQAANAYRLTARPATPAPAPTSASALPRATDVRDQVDLKSVAEKRSKISRLVAAQVDQQPEFKPDAPAPGNLPLYRHPADRNAAAVGVDLGRRLDLQG